MPWYNNKGLTKWQHAKWSGDIHVLKGNMKLTV